MELTPTLIDNSAVQLSMVTALKACIAKPGISLIRIATGYWDIPGMALILKELESFLEKDETRLKLLIGKDPYVYANMMKNPKFMGKEYPADFIKTSINELADDLKDDYMGVINLLLKYCSGENPKIDIHIFKRNENEENQFLHSKCYIFTNGVKDPPTMAIIGSSNFTQKGLCGNAELNYLDTNPYIITYDQASGNLKGHIAWFDEKWASSDEWTQDFLEQILKKSEPVKKMKINKENESHILEAPLTPYELYIKLLQYKFGDIVDIDMNREIESYLPLHYDRLEYQTDAVKQCFSIMHEHGGFMLADVVGLGKTVVATMLIKHFLSIPDKDEREHKVLIVTPPAIKNGWVDTIADFDQNREDKIAPCIDFITSGSIGKLVDSEEDDVDVSIALDDCMDSEEMGKALAEKVNYGLILIDESHKFRNSNTSMYKNMDVLISSIWERTGRYPYIGLLSATPQNNRPDDLKNQIYLFERSHTDSTLRKAHGGNIEAFFADVRRRYDQLISPRYNRPGSPDYIPRTEEQRKAELKDISTEIRSKVLEDILVRRTRTDVREYYGGRQGQGNLSFPQVATPESLEYVLTGTLPDLFADTMNFINPDETTSKQKSLGYFRYRAIEYLNNPEHRRLYEGNNVDVNRVADQLANIMQMLLVKRLESSFDAFKESLNNLLQYTKNMIEMWHHNCIFICPDIDINAELDPGNHPDRIFSERAEVIRRKIERLDESGRNDKRNNREYKCVDFKESYLDDLERDRNLLEGFARRWKDVEDPKKQVFRKALRRLLPETDSTKKLVIFTESVDTLHSIERVVKEEYISVLTITAKDRNEKQHLLQANFDANYRGETRDDYQVVIATDVLAEGVNLHRAYTIINYDTPWNATRLMQRIGRVNRIGSKADRVYVYNFMPSAEGDEKIQLVNRAYTKIQSFHTLFGEDNQVFTGNEEVVNYALNFSRLIDGEESPMMKYLNELKNYKEQNPQRYEVIAQKSGCLEVATDIEPHESLFLIRNNATRGMHVCMGADGSRSLLSQDDMLGRFRVPVDAPSLAMPEDTERLKRMAKREFKNAFASMRTRPMKKKMDEARNILAKILDHYREMPKNSYDLLAEARRVLDKGNVDVCNLIINIGNHLYGNDGVMLPLTINEIETLIEQTLGKHASYLHDVYGIEEILLALYK